MLITGYDMQVTTPPCDPGSATWIARARVDSDLTDVLPYINALVGNGRYDHRIPSLVWTLEGRHYSLRPREIAVSNLEDRVQAQQVLDDLVDFINRVWSERHRITPDRIPRSGITVLDVFKQLPGTNCARCGVPGCMAFAALLAGGARHLLDCPFLELPENRSRFARLREMGL